MEAGMALGVRIVAAGAACHLLFGCSHLVGDELSSASVVSFYGQELTGDGIFFAIDRFQAMGESGDLERARREVSRGIAEPPARAAFAEIWRSAAFHATLEERSAWTPAGDSARIRTSSGPRAFGSRDAAEGRPRERISESLRCESG
jgi:hypothetical protein